MIRINLLPDTSRGRAVAAAPGGKSTGPSAGVLLAMILFLAIDGAFIFWVFNSQAAARSATAKLQQEKTAKTEDIKAKEKKFQEISAIRDRLRHQIAILRSLDPPNRVLWSEKLNLLAQLVHANVFITKLELKEDIKEIETKESIDRIRQWEKNKAGAKPQAEKIPVVTHTLTVTAVCTGKNETERLDNALKFLADLRSYESETDKGVKVRFIDGFREVDTGSFTSKNLKGRDVTEFTYVLETVPQKQSEATAAKNEDGEAGK